MYGNHEDYGPLATMGDAHREWHTNAGVPMGRPGCPQDACHPVEDHFSIDVTETGVRCGNREAHGADKVRHATAEDVRQCFIWDTP